LQQEEGKRSGKYLALSNPGIFNKYLPGQLQCF